MPLLARGIGIPCLKTQDAAPHYLTDTRDILCHRRVNSENDVVNQMPYTMDMPLVGVLLSLRVDEFPT